MSKEIKLTRVHTNLEVLDRVINIHNDNKYKVNFDTIWR